MSTEISIRRPDDWHIHLRDGEMLKTVLPYTAKDFGRGMIMPNLTPPVTTIEAAVAYRKKIISFLPEGSSFLPLMTCYLTDKTDPDELEKGFNDKVWIAAKLYPAGATTNSAHGVTDIKNIISVLERMEKIGMPLSIHGESPDPSVDIFDREKVYMDKVLLPMLKRYQGLKVVIEHATNAETLDIIRAYSPRVAGTITPHHLILNRSMIFQGGINPHFYCLPIAKNETDRLALRKAATSGEGCFFLGTDTAPHLRRNKEKIPGVAGIFVAPSALGTYAEVFEQENALDKLEAFASLNGAKYYGIEPNEGILTLVKKTTVLPESVVVEDDKVLFFRGNTELQWSVK